MVDWYLELAPNTTQLQAYTNLKNSYGWYSLLTGDFETCERVMREGIKLDEENLYFHTNLAPSLLFQGKYKDAKKEYNKWKEVPFTEDDRYDTFKEVFLGDFSTFEQAGIIPEAHRAEYEKIKAMLQ